MNLIFTDQEKNFIKDNYGKISYLEMAKIMNRNWMDIRNCAGKLGIVVKGKRKQLFSGSKAAKVNENFFESQNPLNSYWAGYIAADATISTVTENQKKLTFKLAEKDKERVLSFKNDIGFKGNVLSFRQFSFKPGGSVFYLIRISNCKIVNDLQKNFKITDRKTYTLEFPDFKNQDDIDAFIIGYIDGDGCIRLNKGYIHITILGNEHFLLKMSERISQIIGADVKVSNKTGCNIHKIEIRCNKAKTFFKHLYPLAESLNALKRKWKKEYLS